MVEVDLSGRSRFRPDHDTRLHTPGSGVWTQGAIYNRSRSPKPEIMSVLNIRPATVDDVPVILSFIRELAEYEKLEDEVVATADILRESLFRSGRGAEVLLGEAGGEPAAFALYFHNFSTFLGRTGIYLEDLFVRPQFRGAGYGRRMLIYLSALAVSRGCGRLEWSVLDWNEPAIGFYNRLGARAMSDWTVYRLTGANLKKLAEAAES